MTDRRPLFATLVLAAVTAAVYLPVFGNGFVHYDDDLYVTDVVEVRAPPLKRWATRESPD